MCGSTRSRVSGKTISPCSRDGATSAPRSTCEQRAQNVPRRPLRLRRGWRALRRASMPRVRAVTLQTGPLCGAGCANSWFLFLTLDPPGDCILRYSFRRCCMRPSAPVGSCVRGNHGGPSPRRRRVGASQPGRLRLPRRASWSPITAWYRASSGGTLMCSSSGT